IVGSLAKGAWSAVAGSIKLIGGHSKDASKGMNGVADATAAIAKHKGAIEALGKTIMVYLAVSKLKAIGSNLYGIAGAAGDVGRKLSGIVFKPRVEGETGKRELTLFGKAVKGTAKGIGKALVWTAQVAWKGASKAVGLLWNATKGTSKLIGRGLSWTAKIAYKGASKAFSVLGAGIKTLGKSFLSLGKLLLTNPIGLVLTAVVALGVAFYEAYKHIKPFREWVNKAFKAVANFGKGIAKWGSNVGKSIGKALSNMSKKWNSFKNSFRKAWNSHWSAMGKSLKNSWNSSVKNTRNFFSNISKGFSSFGKSFKKAWNAYWKFVHNFYTNIFNGIYKTFKSWGSAISKFWNSFSKSFKKAWNAYWKFVHDFYAGIFKKIAEVFKSWTSAISRAWNGFKKWFGKTWHGMWNGIHDFFYGITKSLSKIFSNWTSGTMDALGSFGNKFTSGWNGLVKGVKNIFSGLWKDLKGFARDGMNDVIDIINGGINAVDSVIHAFGGKEKTIGDLSHVHFATGTGVFSGSRNPITRPTMAMLNDGSDSPQTGNKEMVVLPNGDSGIVQGRNTKMMLPAGTEVLSASETAMLMSMQGVTKYAKGTGFFGDILNSVTSGISGVTSWIGKKVGSLEKFFKTAENIIAHPIKSLENLFSWSSKGVSGVMSNIGHGLFNGVEKQAKTWWSTLWSIVDLDGAGDASGLLGAVEKYGKGKRYVWGAAGPDEFDCSGLVMYALKHAFGIDFPHFSGSQIAKTQHISAANAKPGDLIGNNEHIGVYAGNGRYWSAMSPSSHPNIGMSSVSSFPGTPIYGRVRGLSSGDDKDASKGVKANSGLEKIIKSQVGGGFWKFISKLADMFGDASGDEPAGDAVGRWRPDVRRALETLGLSTSSSMIAKVLRQINTESSGNSQAMGGTDGLADGHAEGLMQVKPGTFSAYHLSGHNNIWNGYDNMLAGLNYAKHRYGSGLSFLGNGHGYENGGIINTNQLIEVAEHNKPEMVLPLTNKSRANQLITQASQMVNGNNGGQGVSTNSESNKKLDKLISLMSAILGNMGSVQAVIAKSDVVNAVKSDNKTASQYSQMMGY
ncbi:NlpC/P60 family protein, partial [Pediococcus pentosaceus]|uniref:NlpC/P60 family protein n=1 Tax=Pediococcus pentosaceus TaxID=1255 RepID=UPI002F26B07A